MSYKLVLMPYETLLQRKQKILILQHKSALIKALKQVGTQNWNRV